MTAATLPTPNDTLIQELRDSNNRLINALATKTQTIMRLQQQVDVLFQCVDSICDSYAAGRFEELNEQVARYKLLTTTPATRRMN